MGLDFIFNVYNKKADQPEESQGHKLQNDRFPTSADGGAGSGSRLLTMYGTEKPLISFKG